MKNTIAKIISLITILGVAFYWIYLRFTNPDMTETRLVLTFWKQEIITLILCGIGAVLYNYSESKENKNTNK